MEIKYVVITRWSYSFSYSMTRLQHKRLGIKLVHIDWLGEWLRINLPIEEGERRYPMIRPLQAN
jgi:hypothetical protein